MYIEITSQLRLRPKHLLLMLYRYISGIYKMGDLSALNYIKGYIDGSGDGKNTKQILTVSGHGIGEAERWLTHRFKDCTIDATSFRLLDTQILHFLRQSNSEDIIKAFKQFGKILKPYDALMEFFEIPGLVPYWIEQADVIQQLCIQNRLTIYSTNPLHVPENKSYDLIYLSYGTHYVTLDAITKLRSMLKPGGMLAVLMPSDEPQTSDLHDYGRFADSPKVRKARSAFRRALESRNYIIRPEFKKPKDILKVADKCEKLLFTVLAPASAVLFGELILGSLSEHISERARLEALNQTIGDFSDVEEAVREELDLYLMEAK
ncbi:class I SAM-dependent methyltransferase [bacterium]|nr:class I SAM-dependent methyltransferase [bacterium]